MKKSEILSDIIDLFNTYAEIHLNYTTTEKSNADDLLNEFEGLIYFIENEDK